MLTTTRVFVTGALGLVGFAMVQKLLAGHHEVTGLARSDAAASKRIGAGASALCGGMEDLESLRRGATSAAGVVYTAFDHQMGHMPLATRLRMLLGGLPTGTAGRFMQAALGADRRALETMGGALQGSNRPLVAAFPTMSLKAGALATETMLPDPASAGALRGANETLMRELAARGVRASIVRLPPVVHGQEDRNGFLPMLIRAARKKGESVYLGSGANRWGAVHKLDAGSLLKLALKCGEAGAAFTLWRRMACRSGSLRKQSDPVWLCPWSARLNRMRETFRLPRLVSFSQQIQSPVL